MNVRPPTRAHVPASYYADVATTAYARADRLGRCMPDMDDIDSALSMTHVRPGIDAMSTPEPVEYRIVRNILRARLGR